MQKEMTANDAQVQAQAAVNAVIAQREFAQQQAVQANIELAQARSELASTRAELEALKAENSKPKTE